MSATRGPGGAVWRQSAEPSGAFQCGHLHGAGPGALDEARRRLSHEEYAVAALLAREGHQVKSLPESRRGGRTSDLLVCGTPVEIKSFAPAPERRREPTPQSVFNKLVDGAGQAPHVVLVGRGSGLSAATVRRGLARYDCESAAPALRSVRVLGDGFDLAWSRRPGLNLTPEPPVTPARGLHL